MVDRPQLAEVYFCCQNCGTPLTLDSSLEQVDDQLMTELAAPIVRLGSVMQVAKISDRSDGVRRRITRPLEVTADTDEQIEGAGELKLVGSNVDPNSGTFPAQIGLAAQLFDALTDVSEVDHPLCRDCIDMLFDFLEEECKFAEDEVRDYKRYLNADSDEDDGGAGSLMVELEQMRAEEAELIERLRLVEMSREGVSALREALVMDIARLNEELLRSGRELQVVRCDLMLAEEKEISLANQLRYVKTELTRLQKTNIFNAAFHIWHDTHFGTINGFRLGRLPDEPVSWDEINNAWANVVLLVNSLAKRLCFNSKRRKLVPFGSNSRIDVVRDDGSVEQLPLHRTPIVLGFQNDAAFDQAMAAFLDYLNELRLVMNDRMANCNLPFDMGQGQVVGEKSYSIKRMATTEEDWTKALKCMLINIKWIVTYYSAGTG